jgi:hypothetical protein
MVLAGEVRTGDLLVTHRGEKIVSQRVQRDPDGPVVLHHGPTSYTEMAPGTRCRIRRRPRRVEVVDDDRVDESAGGHVWSAAAS